MPPHRRAQKQKETDLPSISGSLPYTTASTSRQRPHQEVRHFVSSSDPTYDAFYDPTVDQVAQNLAGYPSVPGTSPIHVTPDTVQQWTGVPASSPPTPYQPNQTFFGSSNPPTQNDPYSPFSLPWHEYFDPPSPFLPPPPSPPRNYDPPIQEPLSPPRISRRSIPTSEPHTMPFSSVVNDLYNQPPSSPSFIIRPPTPIIGLSTAPQGLFGTSMATPLTTPTILGSPGSTPVGRTRRLAVAREAVPLTEDAPAALSPPGFGGSLWPGTPLAGSSAGPQPEISASEWEEWMQCQCPEGPGTKKREHWLICPWNPDAEKNRKRYHCTLPGCDFATGRKDNRDRHELRCKFRPKGK